LKERQHMLHDTAIWRYALTFSLTLTLLMWRIWWAPN